MDNESHLRDIIRKKDNHISFLEKELEKYKLNLSDKESQKNIKVIDPIFLEPINK